VTSRCDPGVDSPLDPGTLELYWIPLGAGGHVVKWSGRLYEALSARIHRRRPQDLYHAALTLWLPEGRYCIEQAPIPDLDGLRRGVVAEGPVGLRRAGRIRRFRYEIRCWRDGTIADLAAEGTSSQVVSSEATSARRILEVLPSIPTPTWGRDELGTGEMWNSNSVIAWVLCRSGIAASRIAPPAGGRAPGWGAGIDVAWRAEVAAPTR